MKKAILILMMLAVFGCDQSAEVPAEPVTEAGYSETGVVLETIDVETYTYLRLDVNGSEVWLASNPVWVSEGDLVGFSGAILMKDFHSEVLDRTFSDILFVGNVELIESIPPHSIDQEYGIASSSVRQTLADKSACENVSATCNRDIVHLRPTSIDRANHNATRSRLKDCE